MGGRAHGLDLVRSLASMRFGSALAETTKVDRAAVLALAFADLCVRGGERVGLLGLTRPLATQGVIERFAEAIATDERLHGASGSRPAAARAGARALDGAADRRFLWRAGRDRARDLRAIGAEGAIGELVMIVDPIEETYPFSGQRRIPPSGRRRRLVAPRAQNLREAYLAPPRRASRGAAADLRGASAGA